MVGEVRDKKFLPEVTALTGQSHLNPGRPTYYQALDHQIPEGEETSVVWVSHRGPLFRKYWRISESL